MNLTVGVVANISMPFVPKLLCVKLKKELETKRVLTNWEAATSKIRPIDREKRAVFPSNSELLMLKVDWPENLKAPASVPKLFRNTRFDAKSEALSEK
jgi:hypothetical protein